MLFDGGFRLYGNINSSYYSFWRRPQNQRGAGDTTARPTQGIRAILSLSVSVHVPEGIRALEAFGGVLHGLLEGLTGFMDPDLCSAWP